MRRQHSTHEQRTTPHGRMHLRVPRALPREHKQDSEWRAAKRLTSASRPSRGGWHAHASRTAGSVAVSTRAPSAAKGEAAAAAPCAHKHATLALEDAAGTTRCCQTRITSVTKARP
eukprot:4517183-Pleurochrysis_carterae.AAC.3